MLIIPQLPKKQLFGKNDRKVVEDRKHKLQLYLRTLLMSQQLCKTDLIMDFLSVPKAWLQLISPKKEQVHHYKSQAKIMEDRRLKEKEDEEMKLALALSASLAEVDLNKQFKNEQQNENQYGYNFEQKFEAPAQQNINNINAQVLPSGWTSFRTADGKIFYQNDVTKESTWDRPVVPVVQSNVQQSEVKKDPFGALSQQYYHTGPYQPQSQSQQQPVQPVQQQHSQYVQYH
eukprot:UN05076